MKKIYYILTIIAAALISCSDDTFDEQQTDSLTIEKAKAWFESNIGLQNLANQMRAPNNDSTNLKPLLNWEMAELDNDSAWSVVELPWEYENGIVQVSNSEVSNYAALQNDRSVIKQVIRLVVLQNKKTGDRYGFKMIVVPDLQYMLEKDDAIEQNKYLHRASDLSGTVLFYSVKDEFVNGWKYEAGKITAKVGTAKANEVKRDETKYGASADWVYETITTCYYHHIEQGALKGDLKFDGCSSKTISYYIFDSVGGGGYAPYDSGGGGGTNGGSTTTEKPKDCANVVGGSAYLDDCNECVGGNTEKEACTKCAEYSTDVEELINLLHSKNDNGLTLLSKISNANNPCCGEGSIAYSNGECILFDEISTSSIYGINSYTFTTKKKYTHDDALDYFINQRNISNAAGNYGFVFPAGQVVSAYIIDKIKQFALKWGTKAASTMCAVAFIHWESVFQKQESVFQKLHDNFSFSNTSVPLKIGTLLKVK